MILGNSFFKTELFEYVCPFISEQSAKFYIDIINSHNYSIIDKSINLENGKDDYDNVLFELST